MWNLLKFAVEERFPVYALRSGAQVVCWGGD